MAIIKNLSMLKTIKIEGTDIALVCDFSDVRFKSRLLHLMKRYQGIEQELLDKFKPLESIEDELDKTLAALDLKCEILEDFKNDINNVFQDNIVDKMFGEKCLPDIERYYPLFEQLTPIIKEALAEEDGIIADINKKYGLDRTPVND